MLFTLTIADRGDPILPDPRDPLVQVWRDYEGNVCAYAYSVQDDHWLHIPNVASYQIKHSSQVTAYPQSSSHHKKVEDVFSRVVLPVALHATGMEVLHASAILTSSGVAAFCGMADTGKSTTAFALTQRGYTQWADDAVPFEIKNEKVTAVPLPFGVRLDPDAEEFLVTTSAKENPLSPHKTLKHSKADRLAAIFVLKRSHEENGETVKSVRLSPAEAFRCVLLHGHFFNLKSTRLMRQMVSNYMLLTSIVPVFQVHFRPGFERISLLLDRLEAIFKKLSREIS